MGDEGEESDGMRRGIEGELKDEYCCQTESGVGDATLFCFTVNATGCFTFLLLC